MSDVFPAIPQPPQPPQISPPQPPGPTAEKPPVKVKDYGEVDALSPGTKFLDPEDSTRVVTKPYTPSTYDDLKDIPEGAPFIDPKSGKPSKKPYFRSVGFTAQMLHDMALSPAGRRQALERVYPGKVFEDAEGLFVNDGGTLRRPGSGRGAGAFLGATAAETAPAVGLTGGLVIGGAAGSVEPGPGNVAGAALGMVGGAMAGRAFNNAVLALAGVHEPLENQVSAIGTEGAFAAGGEVIGRGISKIPGAVKSATSVASTSLGKAKDLAARITPDFLESIGITPKTARKFLGTTKEVAAQAHGIAERGGRPAPSTFMPEAPMIKKIEDFDAVFRAQNVFGQAARDYYEKQGADILKRPEIGVDFEGTLTSAEKKVSSEQAGKLALAAARRDMAIADAQLEADWRDAKEAFNAIVGSEGGIAEVQRKYQQAVQKLTESHARAAAEAKNLASAAIKGIGDDVDLILERAGGHEAPGELWRMVGSQFTGYRQAVRLRAQQLYDASDAVGGDVVIPTSQVGAEAKEFLDGLPKEIRDKYPADIRRLARMAGEDPDPNAIPFDPHAPEGHNNPPVDLSFKDARHLRSWLRHGIDYNDLTPDMRQGSLKLFENKLNTLLHSTDLPEQARGAAQLLDQADAYYKSTMPFFDDKMVTTIMKGLEAGAPPNAEVLAHTLFAPEHVESMRRARGVVGENMWSLVQAAHARDVINRSMTLDPGVMNASRFAGLVEDMAQSGILKTGYDPAFANRMLEAARNVRRLEGAIPIRPEETDTLASTMRKAEAAAEQVKKFADADPMKAFSAEVKRIDKAWDAARKDAKAARRGEPLHFLYEDSASALAVRSADKILGSQDLIMAAAGQFGRESPEFNALRQVYVQRFLQRTLGKTGKLREELAGERGITEEVQALMFPGVTHGQMLQLARDMEFLFSTSATDVGGSFAAAARVLNPLHSFPLPRLGYVGTFITSVPGVSTIARASLGKLFALVVDSASHPEFIAWLAEKLKKGALERSMARDILRDRMRLGGWFGAATGVGLNDAAQRN